MGDTEIIDSILKKGDEMIVHIQESYLFRSSLAYLSNNLLTLYKELEKLKGSNLNESQIKALKQLQQAISHFDSFLPHLSQSKFMQPALNWPVVYVHRLIDGFRKNVSGLISQLGVKKEVAFPFDENQDYINKRADLNHFKSVLSGMMSQINTSDAVGIQQQIETKMHEISKALSNNSNAQNYQTSEPQRKPSYDNPMIQMKKKVEELLGQFKSINIENDDLMIQAPLGAGGFGSVCKAIRISTGEIVAVKELRMDRLTMSSWASLYSELEAMASVRHPFVLELVGAHITEPFRIITRFCSGKSLFDRLHRKNQGFSLLTPTQLTIIAYQVAVGMQYLHSINIVHRDLKTLNILLDDECNGFVADFGLSGMMKDNQDLCGGVGTPNYTAPEVLAHQRYGNKVDIYSYGVVLWEIATGKVPYSEMSTMAIYEYVVTRGWRLTIPNDISVILQKLISRCWSRNPSDRPTFDEIVQLFEKDKIYFPNSDKIDFSAIKKRRKCPPISIDYACKIINDNTNPHYQSVCNFIGKNCDETIRNELRSRDVLKNLMSKQDIQHKDSILLLASALLINEAEFHQFLLKGGVELFKACVSSNDPTSIISAMKFGLCVPTNIINELCDPELFDVIIDNVKKDNSEEAKSFTVQFFARIHPKLLSNQIIHQLSQMLVDICPKVEDQNTFNAIVSLLPICIKSIDHQKFETFQTLLDQDFIVPSAFVETLINNSNVESFPSLFINIMKATTKSQLSDVLISFLQKCKLQYPHVIELIWKNPKCDPLVDQLLKQKQSLNAALFFLFCIASNEEAALFLAVSPTLSTLISINDQRIQRIHILTALCLHESFCVETSYMNGIINFVIKSISIKSCTKETFHLVGALSKHSCTCTHLKENGVFELFTQLFLSSYDGNSKISRTILRNFVKNENFIPQSSLIVSCLMQELTNDPKEANDILFTIASIVEILPESVQEHDIQRIIIPEMLKEDPQFVLLALKLLSVCETNLFRNIYVPVFAIVTKILDNPKLLYPEIIESAIDVLIIIVQQYDVAEYVSKTELPRYIKEVVNLLPDDDLMKSTVPGVLAMIENIALLYQPPPP